MTKDEEKLRGGVAVITGAAAGIGSGLARRAGEIGMHVVVADYNLAGAKRVAGEIVAAGGSAEAVLLDVSKPSEHDRFADSIFGRHGSVRLLVNNAGIETLGYAWEIPLDRWEATLNTNLHGVIHGVRAFLPRMLASGEEAWVANVASVGSFGMMPRHSAYLLTKHAIQSFNECLYLDLQLKGARVHLSSVLPGMLRTSIYQAPHGPDITEEGARYRKMMAEMMASGGMDLAEGCRMIMEQIAAAKFWVTTQPEMTQALIDGRIGFLQAQKDPEVAPAARGMLEV